MSDGLLGKHFCLLCHGWKVLIIFFRIYLYLTRQNLAVFNLPQNSQEKASLQIRDFSTGDLGLYSDFVHPKGWNRKEVRRFLADEFKIHPEIRPILQRDPPFFTSNHAAFLLQLLNSGEK